MRILLENNIDNFSNNSDNDHEFRDFQFNITDFDAPFDFE